MKGLDLIAFIRHCGELVRWLYNKIVWQIDVEIIGAKLKTLGSEYSND